MLRSSACLSVSLIAPECHKHALAADCPSVFLFIYALAIPLGLLVAWTILFQPSPHKAHVTFLGFSVSIILTLFITDVIKDAVGRPRPDLIARCNPDLSAPQHELVTISICTESNHHTLHDGWRSFPSGHSSFAFSGLGFVALFFCSQTHAIRPRASLSIALLCLAPLLGAALIAISRLEDYRHDVADVMTGSILGFLVAYFNWRRYYPSLLSKSCDEPHAAPTSGRSSPNGGFQRGRDEEDGYGALERYSIGGDDDGAERRVER